MTLTYFPVIANYISFAQGSTVNGQVTFTPNLSVGQVAQITDVTPPLGDISSPTLASITNGNLQTSPVANAPIYLTANTSDLNLTNPLQYIAEFQVNIGGQNVPVPGFTFYARTPRTTSDAVMTNASTTLTSATASFTSSDVGAVVVVAGAIASGTGGTITTIASVTNPTTVVLSTAATASVSSAALSICQTLDLSTVTPAANVNQLGIAMIPVSGLSDATTYAQGFLTGIADQAEAQSYFGIGSQINQGLAGVVARLNHGRSTIIQALGDSTVYATVPAGGWLGALGLGLGQKFNANVWQCFWNDTNQAYDPPVVLSTSTLGARTANAVGAQYPGATPTGDMEIIACLTPTLWAPPATQTIVSKWNASAAFGLQIAAGGGVLQLLVSSDGVGGDARAFDSTATVPFSANQTGWVRCTFQLNNGSGGSTVKFYTATDGATWTQLGASVIQSGTTAMFNNPSDLYNLGELIPSGLSPLIGTISWIQVRNALSNGVDLVPRLPELWDTPGTVNGGPLILLMNGGHPGAALSYLNDGTRLPKLLTAIYPDVIFTADGFNEGMGTSQFPAAYLSWVNNIKSARPNVPIVVTTQNPMTSPKTATVIAQMADYADRVVTAMATQPGVTVLDTAEAYAGNLATYIGSDGEHPTTAGYNAQGAWMLQALMG